MTTKEISFTVKKKFDYENKESLKEQATEFAHALNILTQVVSPEMLSSIAHLIEIDPKFANFLKDNNPSTNSAIEFGKYLVKAYASHMGGAIKNIFGF